MTALLHHQLGPLPMASVVQGSRPRWRPILRAGAVAGLVAAAKTVAVASVAAAAAVPLTIDEEAIAPTAPPSGSDSLSSSASTGAS